MDIIKKKQKARTDVQDLRSKIKILQKNLASLKLTKKEKMLDLKGITALAKSEEGKLAQSKRKTRSGKAKNLAPCSHCGELLGVRDRRAHGDRGERDRQAEYQRNRTRKDKK